MIVFLFDKKDSSLVLALISDLIGVQFVLVNRVGVLDDHHHIVTKSFRVKLLQSKSAQTLQTIILKASFEMHRTKR